MPLQAAPSNPASLIWYKSAVSLTPAGTCPRTSELRLSALGLPDGPPRGPLCKSGPRPHRLRETSAGSSPRRRLLGTLSIRQFSKAIAFAQRRRFTLQLGGEMSESKKLPFRASRKFNFFDSRFNAAEPYFFYSARIHCQFSKPH